MCLRTDLFNLETAAEAVDDQQVGLVSRLAGPKLLGCTRETVPGNVHGVRESLRLTPPSTQGVFRQEDLFICGLQTGES